MALALAALGLQPTVASACTTCDVGNPAITDLALSQSAPGRLRGALDVGHRELRIGTTPTGFELSEQRLTLGVLYQPGDRFAVQGELPAVRRVVTRANGAREHSMSLGDAQLSLRWLALRRGPLGRHALWVAAGALLPTAPKLRKDGQGLPLERQTGLGAVAPRVALNYGRFSERWSVFATARAAIAARGFDNSRASRSVLSQVAAQYQPWTWLALRTGVRHLWESVALEEGGRRDPDSGGNLVAFEGGASIRPMDALVVRAGVVWPALQWLRGAHEEGLLVQGGVLVDF